MAATDQTHERLRRAILRGQIRPNEPLIEMDLAARYKLSRTPIREVLQRLGTEGLIVRARRGWRVREHTPDEIGEIYEARAALEGFAASLAARRATEEELERIRTIHAGAAGTARERLVEINDAFHDAILDAAHSERLSELARQSREYYFNYRIANLYSDAEAEAAVAQHATIVDALLARDGEAAETASREHVLDALEVIRDKLR